MMILNENYVLNNGVEIPKLGLGTWEIKDEQAAQAVIAAVAAGYRHIDTAPGYHNERGVGAGLKKCGLNRTELFVTTKLDAGIRTFEGAKTSIDSSLMRLELDYIDLMLIHSPKPWQKFNEVEPFFEENRAVWKAFEEAYKAGKVRAIGLSNFKEADIDNILQACTVKPMVNQILVHISNTPVNWIKYNQNKDILVEAYSPLAHGELMKNDTVLAIAEKYKVTIPQLGIRYCLQLGLIPLPKTGNPQHMKINTEVEFEISLPDMDLLINMEPIKNYGEFSKFPVFGGKI